MISLCQVINDQPLEGMSKCIQRINLQKNCFNALNQLFWALIFLFLFSSTITNAQEFVNGDLDGTITGTSSLPTNWLNVPYTDLNSTASVAVCATTDLTSTALPAAGSGISGNPFYGNTFVSGLLESSGSVWDEGIMQTVSGFIIGNTYTINFHQAVVKQFNCTDSSGSWGVYIDNTLTGITTPTFSPAPYNSTSFIWELKTVTFTATSNTHTIKFLPKDDDNSITPPACLRMGIDCIYINTPCDNTPLPIELLSFDGKTYNDKNILQWTTATELNNDYFTLEKSSDAKTFQPIAIINGAGNSTMVLNYSFTDENPLELINYYHLKQTDFNGTYSFSQTIALKSNSKNENDFLIYPNPANNFINLFYVNQNVNDEIKILNTLGKTVIKTNGKNKIDIATLQNGIYFVQVKTNDENVYNQKLIIEK